MRAGTPTDRCTSGPAQGGDLVQRGEHRLRRSPCGRPSRCQRFCTLVRVASWSVVGGGTTGRAGKRNETDVEPRRAVRSMNGPAAAVAASSVWVPDIAGPHRLDDVDGDDNGGPLVRHADPHLGAGGGRRPSMPRARAARDPGRWRRHARAVGHHPIQQRERGEKADRVAVAAAAAKTVAAGEHAKGTSRSRQQGGQERHSQRTLRRAGGARRRDPDEPGELGHPIPIRPSGRARHPERTAAATAAAGRGGGRRTGPAARIARRHLHAAAGFGVDEQIVAHVRQLRARAGRLLRAPRRRAGPPAGAGAGSHWNGGSEPARGVEQVGDDDPHPGRRSRRRPSMSMAPRPAAVAPSLWTWSAAARPGWCAATRPVTGRHQPAARGCGRSPFRPDCLAHPSTNLPAAAAGRPGRPSP